MFKIITLCGSIKFKEEFLKIQEKFTLEGYIVLTPIFFPNLKKELLTEEVKTMLAKMHKQKIAMSDLVIIVNVRGYLGESTKEEIRYAQEKAKKVIYYTDLIKSKQ